MGSTTNNTVRNNRRGLGFPEFSAVQWRHYDKTADRNDKRPKMVRSKAQLKELAAEHHKVRSLRKPKRLSTFDKPTIRQLLLFLLNLSRNMFCTRSKQYTFRINRFWARDAIRGIPVYAYYRILLASGPIVQKFHLQRLYNRYRNIGRCRTQLARLMELGVHYQRVHLRKRFATEDKRIVRMSHSSARYKLAICAVPCQCYHTFFPEKYTQEDHVWSIPTTWLGALRRFRTPVELDGDELLVRSYISSIHRDDIWNGDVRYYSDGCSFSDGSTIDSLIYRFFELGSVMNRVPLDHRWDYIVKHKRAFKHQILACPIIANLTRNKKLFGQLSNYSMKTFDDRWSMKLDPLRVTEAPGGAATLTQ